jgi:hypothetical protein
MNNQFRTFFGEAVDNYARMAQRVEPTEPMSNILLSSFFFMGFAMEFIDSQLEWIFMKLTDTDANSQSWALLTSIAAAHRVLIPKLVRTIIEKLDSTSDANSCFWQCALGAVLISVPQLLDVFKDVVKIIQQVIETNKTDRFKSAQLIVTRLLVALTGIVTLQSPSQTPCGRFIRFKDINLNLYRIPLNNMIEIAEAVYTIYRPIFERFPTLELEQQFTIVQVLKPFGSIFMLGGHCATMIRKPLPPQLAELFMQFFGHIREWMKSKLNSELIVDIINALVALIQQKPSLRKSGRVRIIKRINDQWTTFESNATAIIFCATKQLVISTLFVFEQDQIMEDFIRDVICPCLYHDFLPIRTAARHFILSTGVAERCSFIKSLLDSNLSTLARQDKTEGECLGALNFLLFCSSDILSDPEILVRFIRVLFTMTFNSEWKIHEPISDLMTILESDLIFVRRVPQLVPAFTELQHIYPSLSIGSLSEGWLRSLTYFIAMGPAPCQLAIFQQFWQNLLNVEYGRKGLILKEVNEFVWALRPKVPRIVIEGLPSPESFIDSATAGFWAEPRRLRVQAGPARHQESEVRDWLVGNFSESTAGSLINVFVLQHESAISLDINVIKLWTFLSWAVGPTLLDAIIPHIMVQEPDLPSILVRLEMAIGVVIGVRRWPDEFQADALKRVVKPIVLPLATQDKGDMGQTVQAAFHLIIKDADYRRS